MILNKAQMYSDLQAGKFGNTGWVFPGFVGYLQAQDFLHTWRHSTMMIRTLRPGGRCIPNIPQARLHIEVGDVLKAGYLWDELMFSPMAPDEKLRLQGYAMQWVNGLYLHYSTEPGVPMREGLDKYGKHARGLLATSLIQEAMDPADWDDFNDLLAQYPDHVIEFTAYNVHWGQCPRRNTAIWEVRKY